MRVERVEPGSGVSVADDVTRPRELVVNITLRCPLKCGHCCFSSDSFQQGHLSLDDVRLAIDQASALGTMEIVHFVGGDPFLHADIMAEAIAHASRVGLRAGATTSAYWARSAARARAVLQPLAQAGLSELTVSYDDEHAAFVRESSIAHAVQAALALGLTLRVAVVVGPGAVLTAARLRERLGLSERPDVKVYETTVNSTGRAEQASDEARTGRAALEGVYRGPCHSVLRTITVNQDGAIMPCCGVLPHHPGLIVGDLHGSGIGTAVRGAYADALLKWIAFEGPVAVLSALPVTQPDFRPDSVDGICTACDRIFGDAATLAEARARAHERRDRIGAYERIYRASGHFQPPVESEAAA